MLGVVARFDEGVDQRRLVVVHPKPGGMVGSDDELIFARVGGEDRAVPADRELQRVELLRAGVRPDLAKVKQDLGIGPFDQAFVVALLAGAEILAVEAVGVAPF